MLLIAYYTNRAAAERDLASRRGHYLRSSRQIIYLNIFTKAPSLTHMTAPAFTYTVLQEEVRQHRPCPKRAARQSAAKKSPRGLFQSNPYVVLAELDLLAG